MSLFVVFVYLLTRRLLNGLLLIQPRWKKTPKILKKLFETQQLAVELFLHRKVSLNQPGKPIWPCKRYRQNALTNSLKSCLRNTTMM